MRERYLSICAAALVFVMLVAFAAPTATGFEQPFNAAEKIREILTRKDGANFDTRDLDLVALQKFYEPRSYQPAWSGGGQADQDGRDAFTILQHAADEGLEPDKYHVREIDLRRTTVTTQSPAEFDVRLSDGILRYARDQRQGRSELRTLDHDVALPMEVVNPAELNTALRDQRIADFLSGPSQAQYSRLKHALARYRDIAAKGDWPRLRSPIKDDLGVATRQTELLRSRLAYEDRLASDPASDLQAAVERFQRQHGLDADGQVGPKTVAALDTPASQRAQQIAANMERWRWVPRSLGSRYILVNAADATLAVIDAGKTVLTSRVVVGKRSTPTAMFNATVAAITINPVWNIPSSIVRNEILPKARRSSAYLRHNHIVADGDGGYRQLPGANNALGLIKLEMPNRFSAYLHDTSAPSLFARDERHLSHGCIRVQEIRSLASFALSGDLSLGLEKIDATIASGQTERIALDKPLPVYVLYWTVIANEDGTVDFHPDVYGRDQRLLATLGGQHLIGKVTMNSGTECKKS